MGMDFAKQFCLFFFTTFCLWDVVLCQVCSPPGQLCTKTTDCCRGCCEQYMCVERYFSCSGDLVGQPGSSSCRSYFCPTNQICYLREVCPPENPCPSQPFCRPAPPAPMDRNETDNNSALGGIHRKSGYLLGTIITANICVWTFNNYAVGSSVF